MGCVSSKSGRSNVLSPEYRSGRLSHRNPSSVTRRYDDDGGDIIEGHEKEIKEEYVRGSKNKSGSINISNSRLSKKGGANNEKKIGFSFNFGRQTQGEHVAASWPSWLTSAAGGAVEGWTPLRSERFERLEKIGQGTYSSVCRARDLETGKMVAIKKIRFNYFNRESVRFMAREISILRRLDHPNVMKLEGIITSRLSYNIYLVFEYMEHDLAGLLSCPDIRFTESQIKCYMKQLLEGLKHCHSLGIMHRDIKTSNILVNNNGILKIADFGLANFVNVAQPLTSRVVTLWYRPPELLLGSTSYNVTVDLWSVGCVFAELFVGRAVLKGRTEVEQLHKIFKLCGSPPDDYWKRSKLPLASVFKPQQTYTSMLQERCKDLPKTAANLIETFLSVDPSKRGTASIALVSEYFKTKPYACPISSMPKYPPNKEIDAKFREEARRRNASGASVASTASNTLGRVHREPSNFSEVAPIKVDGNVQVSRRGIRSGAHKRTFSAHLPSMTKHLDTSSEVSQMTVKSQNYSTASGPVQRPSNSLALARLHDSSSSRFRSRPSSKSQQLDTVPSDWQTSGDSYHSSGIHQSQEPPEFLDHVDQHGKVRAVPLQIHKTDSKQHIGSHQDARRSRFYENRGGKENSFFDNEYYH